MKDNRKQTGNEGENRASDYLEAHGFTVLNRNWATRTGEIDIIAYKAQMIVFVEVKTLPSGTPEMIAHVVDRRKQQKIIKTAKCFLSIHREYNESYVRFDVIVVDMPGFLPVYHIENAFSEFL